MGTTTDKLNHIINTKEGIRQEINRAYNAEEINTSDTFNSYIQKLEEHPYYLMKYIERSIESIQLSSVMSIGDSAFSYCSNLTSASFPNATSIGNSAFQYCSNLTSASFPNATNIGINAFYSCISLTSVSFPNATSIGTHAFNACSKLTNIDIPNATSIGDSAFYNCSGLTTIYVGTNISTVCTLSSTGAFGNCTKLTNIYVPANLVSSYKSATNWSSFADKIVAEGTVPIGGKIFYDAGDNGATYTFYDSSGNVINDTSISGLQNAVLYKVEGIPTKDRFYAVYPSMLNSGNYVCWGFYHNADIKSSGGNKVNTGTAIGTGKTATQAILNYIDTYASSETVSSSRPSSDISQASPNGYNLYRNCGTSYNSYNYLWDVLRDANNNSLEGHNDWFIPSKDEMNQIVTSGVISSITGSSYLWSSSAYSSSNYAWNWYFDDEAISNYSRTNDSRYVVCRAF